MTALLSNKPPSDERATLRQVHGRQTWQFRLLFRCRTVECTLLVNRIIIRGFICAHCWHGGGQRLGRVAVVKRWTWIIFFFLFLAVALLFVHSLTWWLFRSPNRIRARSPSMAFQTQRVFVFDVWPPRYLFLNQRRENSIGMLFVQHKHILLLDVSAYVRSRSNMQSTFISPTTRSCFTRTSSKHRNARCLCMWWSMASKSNKTLITFVETLK